MTSEDDRDRAVERLLRRSSAGATGSPRPGRCLDPEIAAAWVDGGLLPHERAAVESHVSECTRCQAIVATLTRTTPAGRSGGAMVAALVEMGLARSADGGRCGRRLVDRDAERADATTERAARSRRAGHDASAERGACDARRSQPID